MSNTAPDLDNQLQTALILKDEGNSLFKLKQYSDAVTKYSSAIKFLGHVDIQSKDYKKEAAKLYGNRAECRLRLNRDYETALVDAEKSLELDPSYIKGFYRRGRLLLKLERLSDALRDFQIILREDPNNALALASCKITSERIRKEGDRNHAYYKACTELKKFRGKSVEQGIKLIDTVLAQVVHSESFHRNIVDLDFTRLLTKCVISLRAPLKLRVKAMQGLTLCLMEFTQEDFSVENVKLKEDAFSSAIPQLLLLFAEIALLEESENKELLESITHFLGRVIGDSELSVFCSDTTKTLSGMFHKLDSQVSYHHEIVQYICHALSIGSMAGGDVLEEIRTHTAAHLLFSSFAQSEEPETREAIVRCLALMSGKRGVDDKLNDGKRSEKAEKFVLKTKQMVRVSLQAQSIKHKEMGCRALSLVLQADYKNGCQIAATSETLSTLLAAAVEEGEPLLNHRAAEALALCCSQTEIHQAIIKAGRQDIFIWLYDSLDVLVRAHACLAMAKFAAIDEDARELALKVNTKGKGGRTLECIMEILHEHPPSEKPDRGAFGKFLQLSNLEKKEPLGERASPLHVSIALEALSYLMLHINTKLDLINKRGGAMVKDLVAHAKSRNRSDRHGVLMILLNATLSAKDKRTEFTKIAQALRELKETVSKGMPYDIAKEENNIADLSGTEEQVLRVRKALIDLGGIEAIFQCMRLQNKEDAAVKETQKKDDSEIEYGLSLNIKLMETVAQSLLNCTSITNRRGKMTQQGAVRLLLDIHKTKSDKARVWSATGLARLAISLNPVLFNPTEIPGMCQALVALVTESRREIDAFEALLGLTNLASLNDETRGFIIMYNGWDVSQNGFNMQSEQIHLAALELECNLLHHENGVELCIRQPEADLKIFVLFCKHTDEKIVCTATACLANCAYDEECAKVIARHGGVLVLTALAQSGNKDIVMRAEAALDLLADNGYSMQNFAEHGVDAETIEELRKPPEEFEQYDSDSDSDDTE